MKKKQLPEPKIPLTVQGCEIVEQRMAKYGPPISNFKDIAAMWSVLLTKHVSPIQVVQCMIALKQCREKYKHDEDNIIDIAGYNYIHEILIEDAKSSHEAENNG